MILTQTQDEIIKAPGNLVVRASAGTGKTYTLVNKIAKEIGKNNTHKVIAAITFTIKAAQEIKDRLSVDVTDHFIGTNNSFAIEEVIKPFLKDVSGAEFDLDMSTDYSVQVTTFEEGIEKIRKEGVLCSYSDNKKNFIFELAYKVVEQSLACQLYLRAKYFKIYIDEYQDCDALMHKFFMYLCEKLNIETFIVGDEKQSIYGWRGAFPDAFKSIWENPNFNKKDMSDNFRSCPQIQNYSNLLFNETRHLFVPTENLDNIIWLNATASNWTKAVLSKIDPNKTSALLRYVNCEARTGADLLTSNGLNYIYIPKTPIATITTNTAWLYLAIAKYIICEEYSVYDLISEIPIGGAESREIPIIRSFLDQIEKVVNDEKTFGSHVEKFAAYLGCETRTAHIKELYKTVKDDRFHAAFEADKYQHIAITFHSSKGLEFEQVIIFAEDYKLSDQSSVYNHYVAVTRAKSKVIIVKLNNYKANCFQTNLQRIFSSNDHCIDDVVSIVA